MVSHLFCGVDDFPDLSSISVFLNDWCIITGVVSCLPFLIPFACLVLVGTRSVCNAKGPRRYISIQGDEDEESNGAPAQTFHHISTAFIALLHIQLLLCTAVFFCLLIEGATLVTLEHFEWFQFASVVGRFLGLIICLTIYRMCDLRRVDCGLLVANLAAWTLAALAAALQLRWQLNHQVPLATLPFAISAAYAAAVALLAICDACLLAVRTSCGIVVIPFAEEDDPALGLPASPAVAVHLSDPALHFVHDRVDLLSRFTYVWITPLLVEAWRQPLVPARLGKLPYRDSSQLHFQGLYRRWKRLVSSGDPDRVSLQWILWRHFAFSVLAAYVAKQASDLLTFAGPLALKGIVQFISDRQRGRYVVPSEVTWESLVSNGWVLAFFLLLANVMQAVLQQMYFFISMRLSLNVQAALMSLIYNKALELNIETLPSGVTVGSISNHMSVDVNMVATLFQIVHYCFTVPVQLGITTYLLYTNLGWAGPASLLVVLLFLPVQFVFGKLSAAAQKRNMARNDVRLKMLNELLQGIKIIKFYAWETLFVNRIGVKREEQLRALLTRKLWGSGTSTIAFATPSLVSIAGFALFTLWSPTRLTPGVAFSVLALFNALRMPIFILPMAVNSWINAGVSLRRIRDFLLLPAMDRRFLQADLDAQQPYAMEVQGEFKWPELKQANDAVKGAVPDAAGLSTGADRVDRFNFQVEIPRGSLTMVVGVVGSGKSTLIKTVLGEVPCVTGTVRTHGRLAYVPQQAAIFNATLRDNVLFGQPYEDARYQRIIAASGLLPDLDILPNRDLTEIGSKGINLSGGQKQRVSLARALYAAPDVCILDDPLSALDAHVGEHVFREAVLGLLVGEGKTVLMATHQLQYLKAAHQVLLLAKGAVQARGTLEELTAVGHDLRAVAYQSAAEEAEAGEPDAADAVGSPGGPVEDGGEIQSVEDVVNRSMAGSFAGSSDGGDGVRRRSGSRMSRSRISENAKKAGTEAGKLVQEEERQYGAVDRRVYAYYFSACGLWGVFLVLLVQVLIKGVSIASDLFLSHWSSQGETAQPDHSAMWYLCIFAGLTFSTVLAQCAGSVSIAFIAVRGSRALHHNMLDCVARCPMAFFDTTPLGRLVNRFSNDVNSVDAFLAENLSGVLRTLLNLLGAVLTMVALNPIQAVVLLPVFSLYAWLQHFFRCTSRDLQRLQTISKSPIYAHLSETLGGLSTIRAYRAVARFSVKSMETIDRNVIAALTLNCANRWLGLWLDVSGAVIVCSTALFCIAEGSRLSPGLSGLCLTYALTMVQSMTFFIRSVADAETMMNSVERVAHYSKLETEMPSLPDMDASAPSPQAQPHVHFSTNGNGASPDVPAEWPSQGAISLHHFSASYRAGLPTVLKSVSLRIAAGERVGICGRTGSGKSSLLLALFRMLRVEGGRIAIDGVDIATVPLGLLRARMAIIPQDAVLFAGTVRYNLDPSGQVPDAKLWDALRVAQLANAVTGLDQEVLENGENFSMGQRQLFCLARAFLKGARILCLDEATASVDQDTDRAIQELIRTAFTSCTVITIAHRLSTILDYDKALVLGEGRVLEFDRPSVLLQEKSVFRSLVEASQAPHSDGDSAAP